MPSYCFLSLKPSVRLLSLLLLLPLAGIWGQNALVLGKIADKKTGEGIPGVLVIVSDQPTKGAQTDVDGKFRLDVPPGKVKLELRAIGYENVMSEPLILQAGQTFEFNYQLTGKMQQLGTFVTSASKYEQEVERISMTVDVLRPNIIENKNTTSMKDALQQVPGVSVVNNEPQIRSGSGFSFGAGSRVMILVDDMPLLSGDAGRPSWGFLPVENIEQVEVVKGASSVLYGSAALSGAIHIRTAYPRDTPQTKINTFTGIYNNPRNRDAIYWGKDNPAYSGLNFFHSRKIKNTDLVIGGNIFHDKGFKGPVPPNPSEPGFNPLAEQRGEFENRVRLNFSLRRQSEKIKGMAYGLNGNGMISRSTQTLIWYNADSGMYRSFPGAITLTQQSTAYIDPWISYTGNRGWKHHLRNRYYYLDNNNDNNQSNKSHLIYNEYQVQKRIGEENNPLLHLSAGIVSALTYGVSDLFKGNLDPDTSLSARSEAHNLAAYVQLEKTLFKILNLSAGARYEYFSISRPRFQASEKIIRDKDSKPVFRAGANLKLGRLTFLKASFGQGFRFPTMAEKYIRTQVGPIRIYPNDSIRAESSWNAEAGIKQVVAFGRFIGYLDVVAFVQQFENNIEFNFGQFGSLQDPFLGLGFASINIGRTRVSGGEATLAGRGKIGKYEINILAGYTYTLPVTLEPNAPYPVTTDGKTPLTYNRSGTDSSGNLLKYRFRHLFKTDLEASRGRFNGGFSLRYNSFMENIDRVFEDLDQTLPLFGLPAPGLTQFRKNNNRGIWVVDIRLHIKLNNTVRIGFVVNNLFNVEYALRPMVIEAPRTTAVQLMLAF
jgi:outer membrane receptor protein involved in Fe transport